MRELFVDPFHDNVHVRPSHSAVVIDLFARTYTSLPTPADPPTSDPEGDAEVLATLWALERQNEELQETCGSRQLVTAELQAACDERLALIERLDAELASRSKR